MTEKDLSFWCTLRERILNLNDKLNIRAGIKGCSTCGGVGFYLEEIVLGSNNGKLSLCHCLNSHCLQCPSKGKPPYYEYDPETSKMIPCACHEARMWVQKIESSIIKANIPPRYQYKFLTSIDFNGRDLISLLAACDWANDLVSHWKDANYKRKGMYLWGGTGSGKTLLACVILNELIFRYQVDCKYAKISKDFLDALKDTYQKGSEFHGMERNILEEFVNVDVLVIDDFGV